MSPGPGVAMGTEVACRRMGIDERGDAAWLLGAFLRGDAHYLASSSAYGDGGADALQGALALFLARPELGFAWLAYARNPGAHPAAVGACVVCYAISTSRGTLVAKLDDVSVDPAWRGRGVGKGMLSALAEELRHAGVTRIDTACHRDNGPAWQFYARLGYCPLHEERLSLLLA